MHIPDGYLSPSTCVTLYAASGPFWYVALNRVKQTLNTRTIPLLSVFAAFCFVIMMFNLPLPGGTTGHAVGMGMASIVLGPWVSILAISMTLLIQALFFGDGGITAFGANCFNMAIAGSLTAYGVYRIVARGAEIKSARRVIAAALGGYAGINVAAFCAAVEFGIQPVLFHDAAGTPLYAPYGLTIAIPAMMIGHLTFAGMAELVISAGVIAYLQRTDSEFLRFTAPDAPPSADPVSASDIPRLRRTSRKLWVALALVLILTPLGILAVGSAWGEWSAGDFSDSATRVQITAASGNHAPPSHVPAGLRWLSSFWKAPLDHYTPPFIQSPHFGYFVAALVGVCLILILTVVFGRVVSLRSRGHRSRFIEGTLRSLLDRVQQALFAEEVARSKGFLQSLDPRVKLAGVGLLIVAAISIHRLLFLLALFGLAVLLGLVSRVSVTQLAKRIWIAVLVFTGTIALPAIFLVPGQTVFRIPVLHWAVTFQGLASAAFLTMRAETAATLSLLLVLCTPWNQLLRALRFFKIPEVVVVIVEITYRYIFLLLRTAQDMIESRQTRLVGRFEPREQRRFAAATVGTLLDKSLQLSGEVHTAMRARGFRGDVRLLDDLQMKTADWVQCAGFATVAFFLIWLGH